MTNFDDQIAQLSMMLEFSQRLQERIVAILRRISTYIHVEIGEPLFVEGDDATNDGCVLVRGAVHITKSDGFKTTVEAPALLGDMKQFHFEAEGGRIADVRAVGDVSVLRFDWDAFYAALAENTTPDEMRLVKDTVQSHAWMHYLEIEDEL